MSCLEIYSSSNASDPHFSSPTYSSPNFIYLWVKLLITTLQLSFHSLDGEVYVLILQVPFTHKEVNTFQILSSRVDFNFMGHRSSSGFSTPCLCLHYSWPRLQPTHHCCSCHRHWSHRLSSRRLLQNPLDLPPIHRRHNRRPRHLHRLPHPPP